MRFDYTKGNEAKFKVTVIYSKQDDFYFFSNYDEAKAFYDKAVKEQAEEVASITLRDLSKRGSLAVLERFSNFDETRTANGVQVAYYEPKDKTVYISTACLTPHSRANTKEARKEFRESFDKSYDERIELYTTPEEKATIKAFLEKHKGAKVSEFTTLY